MRWAVAVGLLGLGLAACGGAGAVSTEPVGPSSTVGPARATTTKPPVTAPPTTIPSTTAAPTTAPAPTSTTEYVAQRDKDGHLPIDVERAFEEALEANNALIDAFTACLGDPSNCDVTKLAVVHGGPAEQSMQATVQRLRDAQQYAAPGPEPTHSIASYLSGAMGRVTIWVCTTDSGITKQATGEPGTQDDLVVDDSVVSSAARRTFIQGEGGKWLLESGEKLGEQPGLYCSQS